MTAVNANMDASDRRRLAETGEATTVKTEVDLADFFA